MRKLTRSQDGSNIMINEQIKDLEKRLLRAKDPLKRLYYLLELGEMYRSIDIQKSFSLAKGAFELSTQYGNKLETAHSLNLMASYYVIQSEYTSALQAHLSAVNLCDEVNNQAQKSLAMRNMARTLEEMGKYDEALRVLNDAFRIQEGLNLKSQMASSLTSIGRIYVYLSDRKRALEYFYRAMGLLKEEPNKAHESMLYDCLGGVYESLDEPDKAVDYFFKSLALYREANNLIGESATLGNIGVMYREMGKFELAYEYLLQSLKIQQEQHIIQYEILTCADISQVCISLKCFDRAVSYSSRACTLSNSMKNPYAKIIAASQHGIALSKIQQYEHALIFLCDALEQMRAANISERLCDVIEAIASCYERMQQYAKALEYNKLLLDQKIRKIQEQSNADLRTMEARIAVERMQAEKELLMMKNEKLRQEVTIRTNEVAALGLQAIQKNDFLLFVKAQTSDIAVTSKEAQKTVRTIVRKIEQRINTEASITQFNEALHQLHGEFLVMLHQSYPLLSKTERRICSLIKLRLTSKEIADLLFISIRTIEWHRRNIRRKLGLPEDQEINHFLEMFGPDKIEEHSTSFGT